MKRLLLSAMILLGISRGSFAEDPPVPELPLIKTAAELKALKPVRVESGWDVRLGYADAGPDAGPWVLVFCDAQLAGEKVAVQGVGGIQPLGPLDVRVTRDGEERAEQLAALWAMELTNGIYVTSVPREGRFRITVLDGNVPIAQTKLPVEEIRPQYWQTLLTKADGENALAGAAPVIAQKTGAAYPVYQGVRAVLDEKLPLVKGFEEELLKAGLPGTMPMNLAWDTLKLEDLKKDAAPLVLSLEKGQLTIRRRGGTLADLPQKTLIARWWVNDKLVDMEVERDGLRAQADQQSGRVRDVQEMAFAFGYPDSLGKVKMGDKIGLQVMYCPYGFSLNPYSHEHNVGMNADGPRVPVVSNKLEFVLTDELFAAREKTLKI